MDARDETLALADSDSVRVVLKNVRVGTGDARVRVATGDAEEAVDAPAVEVDEGDAFDALGAAVTEAVGCARAPPSSASASASSAPQRRRARRVGEDGGGGDIAGD